MLLKNKIKSKSGFTLIELIVTIAILSVLSMILMVSITSYIQKANNAADLTTVSTLNNITSYFRATFKEDDPFIDNSNSSRDLMEVLIDNELIGSIVKPQTKDTSFIWNFNGLNWEYVQNNLTYTIKSSDGLRFGNNGRLEGSYAGTEKDVLLLSALDGQEIKSIYQDVFKSKGLTSFIFDSSSKVTQIHARAFLDNILSHIIFPETLTPIDLWAFKDNNLTEINLTESMTTVEQNAFANNNITKITIGSKLNSIGTTAFGSNHAGFVAAYTTGGAGTYLFINNVWTKQ